jgi:hypothetical protein
LVGFERLKQEEVIGAAMGSLYQGEVLYPWVGHLTLTCSLFSRFRFGVFLDNHACLLVLTDSDIRECIGDALPISGPSPLPAGAKTSASRNRCRNWKRPAAHVR